MLRPFGIRRQVARANLAYALPERAADHASIEREAFSSLVRIYLELPVIANMDRESVRALLSVENGSLLQGEEIERRGALLLSGHIGNWELLALASAMHAARPFLIPVRPQSDFGHLQRLRERFGNRTTETGERGGFRGLQHLARGGIVALLADQSPAKDDPPVRFFNLDTRFHSGPARLALRLRPVVILGFAERRGDGGYRVRLERMVYEDLNDDPSGRIEFTQRYATKLEEAIRRDPASWVWHHRRWKHTAGVGYEG